ncbi:MAG: DUF3301 domain-containing protein [Rhodanobacteraceae bacterium]
MIGTWICLLATGALVWAWFDAMRARELAIRFGREICERASMQLLDQSVALRRLRLHRTGGGNLEWRRRYSFDISMDGSDRHSGHLDLSGKMLETWSLPLRTTDTYGLDPPSAGGRPAAGRLLDHAQTRAP